MSQLLTPNHAVSLTSSLIKDKVLPVARVTVCTSLAEEKWSISSYQSKLLEDRGCKHTQVHANLCQKHWFFSLFLLPVRISTLCSEEHISCSQSNNDNFYAVRQSLERTQGQTGRHQILIREVREIEHLCDRHLCSPAPLHWRISTPPLLSAGRAFLCGLKRLKVRTSINMPVDMSMVRYRQRME